MNVSTNKISNGGGKALAGNLCARCESDIKTDATPKTVPTNSHQHQQSETRSRSRVSMRRSKMLPPPPLPRANYSAATPIELEIQREQRVRARRLASAPPRPVQRHAEMRVGKYLLSLLCSFSFAQRVLVGSSRSKCFPASQKSRNNRFLIELGSHCFQSLNESKFLVAFNNGLDNVICWYLGNPRHHIQKFSGCR